MNAEELEFAANEARRRADIAKHKPLDLAALDRFGDEIQKKTCHAQVNLMELAITLQNAYAEELQSLWQIIQTLRAESLYWRQAYADSQAREEAGK